MRPQLSYYSFSYCVLQREDRTIRETSYSRRAHPAGQSIRHRTAIGWPHQANPRSKQLSKQLGPRIRGPDVASTKGQQLRFAKPRLLPAPLGGNQNLI